MSQETQPIDSGVFIPPWSDWKKPTEYIQKVADQVRGDLEKRMGRTYPLYIAVRYREQEVFKFETGVNYEIIVELDRGLPGTGLPLAVQMLVFSDSITQKVTLESYKIWSKSSEQ